MDEASLLESLPVTFSVSLCKSDPPPAKRAAASRAAVDGVAKLVHVAGEV